MPFLILFIILPLLEIYAFLNVGEEIGLLNTLALCFVTALIGGFLVRKQGLVTLFNAQKNLGSGTLPIKEIFEGFCIVIAGVLLMTPGFITDILGFTLLIPFARDILRNVFSKYGKFQCTAPRPKPNSTHIQDQDDVIEGNFEDLTNKNEPKN